MAGIPEARIRRAGRFLGALIYRVDVPHRRIVRRNLQFAYPDWAEDRVRSTSKRIFENLGTTLLEIIQLRHLDADQLAARVAIDGGDVVAEGMADLSGAVVISAHLGNWEIAPLVIASRFGRPMVSVARIVRPPALDRWVVNSRTRFGNKIIDKQRGLKQMTRSLRQGNILGMLIDQGTKKSEGVKATFFNRTVSATPAAAMLAIRCRCPVYAAFTVREASGFRVIVLPKLELKRTGDLKSDLQAHTQEMLAVIEGMIREYPEQWFWVNKRWKHYYPDLYPEHQARRRRRRRRKFRRLAAEAAARNGKSTPKGNRAE
jgi:KDO2-lipid IV(A) lauroyltransferase